MSRNNRISFLLIAPLLALVMAGFVLPIGYTLLKAIDNPQVTAALPRTTALLSQWDGRAVPDEGVFVAFMEDMTTSRENRTFGSMTRRLNFEENGARTLLLSARRAAPELSAPYSVSLPERVPEFGEPGIWRLIKAHSNPFTASYLLRALDLRIASSGQIVSVDDDQAIFLDLFERTFVISIWVTVFCVLLGYPTAYFISSLSDRAASYAMLFVLIPFWTSILVRTTAWFILLQREGPVNATLLGAGIVSEPVDMIFTRFAVYVAMVHVLLPFLILPLYSVMKRQRSEYLKAAASLGAPPWRQFVSIYLPMTMPGVAAGAVIVFMLSVGFYVTPALVGGLQDQMVSYYIAFFANQTINLGMVAALAFLLLLFTAISVAVTRKLVPGLGGTIKA